MLYVFFAQTPLLVAALGLAALRGAARLVQGAQSLGERAPMAWRSGVTARELSCPRLVLPNSFIDLPCNCMSVQIYLLFTTVKDCHTTSISIYYNLLNHSPLHINLGLL